MAPILFEDEELDEDRKTRDPVATAKSSKSVNRKKVIGKQKISIYRHDTFAGKSLSTPWIDCTQYVEILCYFNQLLNLSPDIDLIIDMYVSKRIDNIFQEVKQRFNRIHRKTSDSTVHNSDMTTKTASFVDTLPVPSGPVMAYVRERLNLFQS